MRRGGKELYPEQDTRQQQSGSQTAVKDSDKLCGNCGNAAKEDAATHHARHDGKGFSIKKAQEHLPFFRVGQDAQGVFFYQPAKNHPVKQQKNSGGQKEMEQRYKGKVADDADAQDVGSGSAPHKAGNQQQGAFFTFIFFTLSD